MKKKIFSIIIITVLLISNIYITSKASNVMNIIDDAASQATDQAKEMFNAKFTGYAGKQKSSSVKALITSVETNNNREGNNKVELVGVTTTAEVETNKTYNVVLGYDDTTGYINKINISEEGTENTVIKATTNNSNPTSNTTMPNTGIVSYYSLAIFIMAVIALILYIKNKSYKEI